MPYLLQETRRPPLGFRSFFHRVTPSEKPPFHVCFWPIPLISTVPDPYHVHAVISVRSWVHNSELVLEALCAAGS